MTPFTLPAGRKGQALAVAVTLGGVVLLWLAIVAPLLQLYQDQQDYLQQQQALLQRMRALVHSLPTLRAAAAEPDTSAPVLLPGASDAVAAASLQESIQRMAASAGTNLTAVETLPPEVDGRWHRLSLRISLNAPYPALIGLMRQIDQAPIRVFMDDLHLHSPILAVRPRSEPIQASLIVYGFRAGT